MILSIYTKIKEKASTKQEETKGNFFMLVK
jgi:hypothetical protein